MSTETKKTRAEEFSGLTVAMITPFKDDEVDLARLEKNINFLVDAGATCLCPVGTTGESPTLTYSEHELVIQETVKMAAGRCKVMAGTGSNCTREAVEMSKWAEKVGADAVLQVAPYYNKPMQEGFYQHFKTVAESVSIPVCLYNIPSRSGKLVEPDTIVRLADEVANIALVKEATGAMDNASKVIAKTDLTVLSGDDSLTLPYMSLGCRGVVSVVGNFIPKDMIALTQAVLTGDLAAAREIHYKMYPLCRDMLSLATNPIPVKAAMKLLGMDTGELRLPMTPLTDAQEQSLHKTLAAYGLSSN